MSEQFSALTKVKACGGFFIKNGFMKKGALRHSIAFFCIALLAACGGGGGGGGGGNAKAQSNGGNNVSSSLTASSQSNNVGQGSNALNLNFSSDSPAVLANGRVTLTWNARNVDSCEASGGWSGQKASSGSFRTSPLTVDTTFKLTCFAQGESAVSLVTVEVTDKRLRWQAPTENVDGTPLTDLAGFNVYWGTSPRSYSDSVNLSANARQWDINLGSGTYYLAVTALDADANESSYSNEVRKIIP